MLTKKFFFGMVLFLVLLKTNGQSTATINDLKTFASFEAQIVPDAKEPAFSLFVSNRN